MGRSYIVHSACIWVLRRVYGAEFVCVANANACACAEKQRERERDPSTFVTTTTIGVSGEWEREKEPNTQTHTYDVCTYKQTNKQINIHTRKICTALVWLVRRVPGLFRSWPARSLFSFGRRRRIGFFVLLLLFLFAVFFLLLLRYRHSVWMLVLVCVCCVHIRNSSFLTLKWPHQMYVVRVWNVQ